MSVQEYNEYVVNKIREIATDRGLSLTKVEEALNYGNGSIGKWKSARKFAPYDRIVAIASYLGVSVETLTGDKETPAPADADADAALIFGLYGDVTIDIDPEELEDVRRYAAFLREKKGKK